MVIEQGRRIGDLAVGVYIFHLAAKHTGVNACPEFQDHLFFFDFMEITLFQELDLVTDHRQLSGFNNACPIDFDIDRTRSNL